MRQPQFPVNWRDLWAGALTSESTGAVFTKPEIVDLILDLVGYRLDAHPRLAALKVLEPSCGDGAFVTRVVTRLVESEAANSSPHGWDDPVLDLSLTAGDINPASIREARESVITILSRAGCPLPRATALAQCWIVEADFLLEPWPRRYDVCIGNPPYVRIENLPRGVLEAYRGLYRSMGDRADLYVAFIERGLELLENDGVLSFIVANRWTKNQYGRSLRSLISTNYHVHIYLDLAHTTPFVQEVSAYPCIVVLDRRQGSPTFAATLEDITPATLDRVRRDTIEPKYSSTHTSSAVRVFERWYSGSAPWVTTSLDEHALMSQMSSTLPTLSESAEGTKVGIGVATGADKVFILNALDPDIETDRLLPLAMPADLRNGEIEWSGHYLVNPFSDGGGLVSLEDYPGLNAHLTKHHDALKRRHVAKTRPHNWYRTIDRIWPALLAQEKLLIRDIQDPTRPVIGVDAPGRYYPHHNLYYVVSAKWPLRALQCLLRSERVVSQVTAHSVAMRGRAVRWQAQVLRRLRVPALADIPDELLERMVQAAPSDDVALINALADEAYACG